MVCSPRAAANLQVGGKSWLQGVAVPHQAPWVVCRVFATLEDGMQHCEERFLQMARHWGIIKPPAASMTLQVCAKRQLQCKLGSSRPYLSIQLECGQHHKAQLSTACRSRGHVQQVFRAVHV